MIGAWNYNEVCTELARRFRSPSYRGAAVRMTGLLFAHPGVCLARDEILPSLEHFFLRSGDDVDFFCAGYGRFWPPGFVPDERKVTEDKPPWLFSVSLFNKFLREIEDIADWHYSGGADLLLMNARFDGTEASLDFDTAVVCDLEQMIKDEAILTQISIISVN
jgi:hypothetical protein